MLPEYFIMIIILAIVSYILDSKLNLNIIRRGRSLVKVTILTFLLFFSVDSWATWRGVWDFGKSFLLGPYVFNLPIEEVFIFIVAPYASIILWETSMKIFRRKGPK